MFKGLSDTVQIRSRHGCHPDTHLDSAFRYSSDTLQIWMPSWYSLRFRFQIKSRYVLDTDAIPILIQIQLSYIVQICTRYGCHPDTHSDLAFRYSSDMLQTRMPSWYSFKDNFQIQFRYAPDTDAILLLIQRKLSDTVQIRTRYGCHPDTHSDSTFLIQFRYAPDTDAILILIQIQLSDTVSDMHQIRMPSWDSFRFSFQI